MDSTTWTRLTQSPRRFDVGLLFIRLMVGWVFVYHGAQKLFGAFGGSGIDGFAGYLSSLGVPLPLLNAYLAGGAELLGGLALLTGFGVRVMSIPLLVTMLVGAFTAHAGKFNIMNGGGEYALTLAVVAAALFVTGPGRYTVASLVTRHGASHLEPDEDVRLEVAGSGAHR